MYAFGSLPHYLKSLRWLTLLIYQWAPSTPQPISVGLLQLYLYLSRRRHLFSNPILAWFLMSARRKRSNLLNSFFQGYLKLKEINPIFKATGMGSKGVVALLDFHTWYRYSR